MMQQMLRLEYEEIDQIDKFILEDVLLIAQNTQILELVKYYSAQRLGEGKHEDQFLLKIIHAAGALLKANAHRRNYHKVYPVLLEEIEKNPDNVATNIPMVFNKVDTNIEFEGFLAQFKSCLDLLAQSLKYIYGIDRRTWKSGVDSRTGERVSGLFLIRDLNNLSREVRVQAAPLSILIQENAPYITRIVKLRDSANHYGKIKEVQGFLHNPGEKSIRPPVIDMGSGEAVFVHEYMDTVMKYGAEFAQQFLITLLSNLIPDMQVGKTSDGGWGWFKKQ